MNAKTTLEAINVGIAAIQLLSNLGLDFNRVKGVIDKARAEGRPVSQEELDTLANEAQASINNARNA